MEQLNSYLRMKLGMTLLHQAASSSILSVTMVATIYTREMPQQAIWDSLFLEFSS